MARSTSSPTSRYWIMLPVDPLSFGSPSEKLLPIARKMATPTVAAIATAARKEAESFTGLEVVTKMIADMICGPAIIVMARGMTDRLMALVPPAFCFLRRQGGYRSAGPARSVAPVPDRLCDRGCRRGAAGR